MNLSKLFLLNRQKFLVVTFLLVLILVLQNILSVFFHSGNIMFFMILTIFVLAYLVLASIYTASRISKKIESTKSRKRRRK